MIDNGLISLIYKVFHKSERKPPKFYGKKIKIHTHKKGISAQRDMKSISTHTSNHRNEKKNNNVIYCPQRFQLSMSNMAHSKYFCGCVQYTTNLFHIRYKKL